MSSPAVINGKEIFALLSEDLAAIEREFGRDTVAGVEAITEIGEYLRNGGGKRIRPALLLLSAKLFDYRGRGAVRLGGASAEQEENLAQYGRDLGMAFQIVDDVLDLTASEEVLGKPVASDLREGKVTMAVIHSLERCTPEERAKVSAVLQERAFDSV